MERGEGIKAVLADGTIERGDIIVAVMASTALCGKPIG